MGGVVGESNDGFDVQTHTGPCACCARVRTHTHVHIHTHVHTHTYTKNRLRGKCTDTGNCKLYFLQISQARQACVDSFCEQKTNKFGSDDQFGSGWLIFKPCNASTCRFIL